MTFIDCVSLKRFFKKCGKLVSDDCIEAVIRRWDLNADAKINIKEFTLALKPIETYTRKATQQILKKK